MAPAPGAKVEAIKAETGVVIGSVANQAGNYPIPFLVPGAYVLRVNHAGFKNVERTGIQVLTGAQVTLDFTLELGGASEKITVQASSPVLETASGNLGAVIDRNQIDNVSVSISQNDPRPRCRQAHPGPILHD